MGYWEQVLQEVLNKDKPNFQFRFTNLGEFKLKQEEALNLAIDSIPVKRVLKFYSLGENYKNIYFTKREAECMVYLLCGKSIPQVAAKLALSPRTVEYYVKNMKVKLNKMTKSDLIEEVMKSDFLKNVDFEY